MFKCVALAAVVFSLACGARAHSTDLLPDYKPLLPQVRARAYTIDPKKGFVVKEIKPGVFMITDGVLQSVFVITGQGVVLFDAPQVLAAHIVPAVAEVTREPITALIYSHAHVDHIGGAGQILKEIPGLQIIAEKGTADFLREVDDPDRPLPTHTFTDHEIFELGSLRAELKVGHWHSASGDLFIYLPTSKVLMAIDTFNAGSAPFMDLDLTQNMHEYLKVFDQMLDLDWDVLVPGHLNNPATRDDAKQMKAYVDDVYATAARIQRAGNPDLFAKAAKKYGIENLYAVGRVVIDWEVEKCAQDLVKRWSDRLDSVDTWGASQCRTALIYDLWDVGPHGHPS